MEESTSKRRPSSGVDSILDRNIGFVEFPSSEPGDPTSGSSLIEQMFMHADVGPVESEHKVMEILSGSGGHLIDVVLYMFSNSKWAAAPATQDLTEAVENLASDLSEFGHIATLTNVVPIIGKSDLCMDDDLHAFKIALLEGIQDMSITPFIFGRTVKDVLQSLYDRRAVGSPKAGFEHGSSEETISSFSSERERSDNKIPPFTVSALPGPDLLEMDASLLMSSSYMPPLVKSELPELISQVLDPDHIPWLRRAACRKYLTWRKRMGLTHPLGSTPGSKPHSADNIAWAARSLSHTARATWLLEQINQEVVRGNIGVLPTAEVSATSGAHGTQPLASSIRASKSQLLGRGPARTRQRAADLPAWARTSREGDAREYDPRDPLRLFEIWDGWSRAVVWSASSGIIIGIVCIVAAQGWSLHRQGS
jgi:hypothetical protein